MKTNKKFSEKAQHDYELVQLAIKKKDQKAYTELMDKYWNNVYYLLLKMVSDKDHAEDLTMETFGKAFKRLYQYTPEYAFSTWLFKIATNNCIDYIRKQKMTTFSIDQPILTEEGETVNIDIQSEGPDPEEQFMIEQKNKLLRKLVTKVKPPRYRLLIEYRYFKEMNYEEICEKTKLPMGTVKAQLFRAKELLYEIIKRNHAKGNM